MAFTLKHVPLAVLNRALEIYGEPPAQDLDAAWSALRDAEGSIDIRMAEIDGSRIVPFAQAVAEYMSLSGPWDQEGDYIEADSIGYEIER